MHPTVRRKHEWIVKGKGEAREEAVTEISNLFGKTEGKGVGVVRKRQWKF